MIQTFVDKFMSNKPLLAEEFKKAHPENYKSLVTNVMRIFDDGEYGCPDSSKIHEIDDGDYQGTLLYVIPEKGYQPSEYWYVKVSYGSCSGCDTLQGIHSYSSEPPTDNQVEQYMTLALHIVQGLKKME